MKFTALYKRDTQKTIIIEYRILCKVSTEIKVLFLVYSTCIDVDVATRCVHINIRLLSFT
jgi:hypothetical protein